MDGSDTLEMMQISANFEGTYPDLIHFVNLLDKSDRLLVIESLNATPQQGGGEAERHAEAGHLRDRRMARRNELDAIQSRSGAEEDSDSGGAGAGRGILLSFPIATPADPAQRRQRPAANLFRP